MADASQIERMKLSASVRRLLRRAFRNAGYQRRICPDFVDVMQAHAIDVVLDVGANDGAFGREIRDRGYDGRIVSFEPNPVAYARLQAAIKGDPKWTAFPLAVGDVADTATLAVAVIDCMSSIKPFTEFGLSTGASVAANVDVPVVRLDAFLSEHPELVRNTYLKIDTQGFEMEVLRGAGDALRRMKAVQAEVALVHTYAGELDWIDVLQWMRAMDFEVATAVCNSTVGAQVREFDFVFVRSAQ